MSIVSMHPGHYNTTGAKPFCKDLSYITIVSYGLIPICETDFVLNGSASKKFALHMPTSFEFDGQKMTFDFSILFFCFVCLYLYCLSTIEKYLLRIFPCKCLYTYTLYMLGKYFNNVCLLSFMSSMYYSDYNNRLIRSWAMVKKMHKQYILMK